MTIKLNRRRTKNTSKRQESSERSKEVQDFEALQANKLFAYHKQLDPEKAAGQVLVAVVVQHPDFIYNPESITHQSIEPKLLEYVNKLLAKLHLKPTELR